MFTSKRKISPLAFCLCFFLAAGAANSQESVDVPQILQENVRAFNLTMDSLQTLTGDLYTLAEATASELQAIRQKMELTPPGTRTYHLERRRYEEKYSAFLAKKYETLAEMQVLRRQTLSHLETILDRMQKEDSTSARPLRENIREEIRRNNERLAETRLEMLQLLSRLKKPELPPEEKLRLSRRLRRLQSDQLALYAANRNRLADLLATTGQHDQDLPGMQAALRTMWENLQSGFAWIDAEMTYTRMFADYRKNRLAIDAQLLEVSGLVERFREAVQRMNASSGLLQEMERLGQQLHPTPDSRRLLPEIPGLKWPGHPGGDEAARELSPAEIDSLERLLRHDLQKP
jgi:hypothetical protein